jgi:Outer membrane protein beta-barrel domain
MKQVLLLITTLVSISLQAQKTIKHIRVGYNFSADHNFRTLNNVDGSSSSDFVIKSRNDDETARFGYTTGLNVCFDLSKLVALETGIQFSNKGYQRKGQHILFPTFDPTDPVKISWVYAYQYIGIPLKAKFSFGKGNLRFVSGIGFTTSLLLSSKQTSTHEYADGSTEKRRSSTTHGYNKIDISPMVSAGIDYKITKKIHLFAEPTFWYGLIKVKDAPVKENLWNAGLNVGLYYVVK